MSPNWLINITAPIVGVPFGVFAASVFIGLMPYNFSTYHHIIIYPFPPVLTELNSFLPYNSTFLPLDQKVCVQAGSILSTVHSIEDILTTWTMIKLGGLAVIAVIPVVIKRVILRRQRTPAMDPILPR